VKYMLLIVNDPKAPPITEAEMPKVFGTFQKITTDLQAQGKYVHSARLRPIAEAKTVRLGRGKPVVVDGPFTETKEGVGGYYMIECESPAEALEWAKKFPPHFSIEVNAVWDLP